MRLNVDRALALALALALGGCAANPLRTAPIDARTSREVAEVRLDPVAMGAALDAYRASRGLGPLRLDPALSAMAGQQAEAMVRANSLSHNVVGGFGSRLAAAGVDPTEAGENLGGGYYSIREAMNGWRGSPEHDANLLIKGATRYGVAIAKDPRTQYRVYWALELASDQRSRVDASLLQAAPGGILIAPPP